MTHYDYGNDNEGHISQCKRLGILKEKTLANNICDNCGGFGYHAEGTHLVECPACDGTGKKEVIRTASEIINYYEPLQEASHENAVAVFPKEVEPEPDELDEFIEHVDDKNYYTEQKKEECDCILSYMTDYMFNTSDFSSKVELLNNVINLASNLITLEAEKNRGFYCGKKETE